MLPTSSLINFNLGWSLKMSEQKKNIASDNNHSSPDLLSCHQQPQKILVWIWYGIAAIVILLFIRTRNWETFFGVFSLPNDFSLWLTNLIFFLKLFIIAALFRLIHLTFRYSNTLFQTPKTTEPEQVNEEAFPSRITLVTGAWLVIFATGSVLGFIICISLTTDSLLVKPLLNILYGSKTTIISPVTSAVKEAVVMMFAAGIGSSITTILAFLRHACVEKNFDRSYAPWYVGRPLMGMLLGLIFYFLIKGGLLTTIRPEKIDSINNLNDWGLAGIGAMVGLFSNNAIEKLRETFHTLFRTEQNMRMKIGGFSQDSRAKLLQALPENIKHLLFFGEGEELKEALESLPEETKKKILKKIPQEIKKVFAPYLKIQTPKNEETK